MQGRLISNTSTDGGTSNFVYRTDGKIRFSQNSFQANVSNNDGTNERFSYTNYDYLGRPTESGEYSAPGGTFASLPNNPNNILDLIDGTLPIATATKLNNVNTYYDVIDNNFSLTGYMQDPGFLKGAVSYTTGSVNGKVTSTTWYNYDDHGRVAWMVKYINGLGNKTVDYTYNHQGNVTSVTYQKGANDEFNHYYAYDADGRLTNVQTSTFGGNKIQQINYYYYQHGPLKRTELGNQLQGIDYVYTPQGWLKAINSPVGYNLANNTTFDPGQDGNNNGFAPDAFGMQLEYFPGDYVRSGSNVTNIVTGSSTNYYNGQVSGMSWQSNKPASVISALGSTAINAPTMYTYTYDNKYQYTGATWGAPNAGNSNTFSASTNNMFQENGINYDPNGNIQAMQHTGSTGTLVDNFTYNYKPNTNQLQSVTNAAGSNNTYGTYTYDEIGRLKSQISNAGTTNVKYDVTGEIISIFDGSGTNLVSYGYDESGNRISRTDKTGTTYYVYDANGSVMAIYMQTSPSASPVETEVPFYGSGRLGTYFVAAKNYVYELRDNVGSVRVALNSTKLSNGQADVYKYDDYYPYGSVAQSGGQTYRYDYQGAYAEKDPVTGYNNFELRMYDSRIGRWLSTDPQGQFNSPYEGMGNDPVMGSDPTGGRDTTFEDDEANKITTRPSNTPVNVTVFGSWINPKTFRIDYTKTPEYAPNPNYVPPSVDGGVNFSEPEWFMKFDHYMKTIDGPKPIFGYSEWAEGGKGSVDDMPRAQFTERLDITGIAELLGSWDTPDRFSIGGDMAVNSSDYIEVAKSGAVKGKALLKIIKAKVDSQWMYIDDLRKDTLDYPSAVKRYHGIFNNFRVTPGYEHYTPTK